MNYLRRLISSLSKREKFYFKKLNADAIEKPYMQLYNYISKHPLSKDIEIKQVFKNTSIEKNFYVECNYLYNHLLRSLHIYRLNRKSTSATLYKYMSYYKILHEKGEIIEAKKMLRRAKSLAYKYDELPILINIVSEEAEINVSTIDAGFDKKLKKFNEERAKIAKEIQLVTSLKLLKAKLIALQYEVEKIITESDDYKLLLKHPALVRDEEPFSIKGKDHWLICKELISEFTGEKEIALIYSLRRLKHITQYEHIFDDFEQLKALNNYLYALMTKGKYDTFYEYYPKLEAFYPSKEIPEHILIYFKTYLKLGIERKTKKYATLGKQVELSFLNIKNHLDHFNNTQRDEIFQHLLASCFMLHNYDRALYFHQVLNEYPNEKSAFLSLKMMKLITYFGLEKFDLLEYEISNFQNAMKRRKVRNPVYSSMINLFKLFIRNQGDETNIFKTIEQLRLLNDETKPTKKYFIDFDYLEWLSSYTKIL